MKRARERMPDAIFAANALVAIGAIQALTIEGGIPIPENIALIGYDDIDFASASVILLSSVKQPAALLGRTAVQLVIDENEPSHQHRHLLFFFSSPSWSFVRAVPLSQALMPPVRERMTRSILGAQGLLMSYRAF